MPEQRHVLADSEVRLTFDGRELAATAGQSLAAALIANGVRSWRLTRVDDRPRGVFCGIGVCFDCLVVLNDVPNVRACVTRVRDSDVVTTQEGTGHGDLAG